MNQPIPNPPQATPTTPSTPAAAQPVAADPNQLSPQAQSKLKKIVIGVIVVVLLLAGGIYGYTYYKDWSTKQRIAARASADAEIRKTIFAIRDDASNFYKENQNYKEWWPKSADLVKVSNQGSTLIYRKPDFQSYIIYAYDWTEQKYFCVDTKDYADYVDSITDTQIKCK